MKKTELALLYMPYASADVARRHLNKCIRRNREPAGGSRSYRLGVFGYIGSHRCRWSLIEKYLGEP